MRQAPAKLSELIEPVVAGLGYELYGIEYLGQGKYSVLRVYIDQAEGITVDDCARVSHQLSAVLDVEDPIASNYELEVSSPGMDRPLLSAAHFQRYVGETVKIKTMRPIDGRSRFSGVLREAQDESAILDIDGESVVIPFEAVNQARLVPEF
jgi:ribosome maturation factor RimP